MSRDVEKGIPANSEIRQLLSAEARNDTPNTYVRLQPDEQLSMNKLYVQGGVSSSRPLLQDKTAALNCNVGQSSSDTTTVITSSSNATNDNESDDDPPPYAAIPPPYSATAPPDHIGWPYGLFSFSDSYSTDGTRRMEIPLTPFQTCLTPSTDFHPEGISGQYTSYPMPLTPYRFFKFDCRRNSFVQREMTDDEIVEKIDDRKSRKYGVFLVAAAVIIFLMALSLIVRFVMEKSWWRR